MDLSGDLVRGLCQHADPGLQCEQVVITVNGEDLVDEAGDVVEA